MGSAMGLSLLVGIFGGPCSDLQKQTIKLEFFPCVSVPCSRTLCWYSCRSFGKLYRAFHCPRSGGAKPKPLFNSALCVRSVTKVSWDCTIHGAAERRRTVWFVQMGLKSIKDQGVHICLEHRNQGAARNAPLVDKR